MHESPMRDGCNFNVIMFQKILDTLRIKLITSANCEYLDIVNFENEHAF